jgi:hypothetical protein
MFAGLQIFVEVASGAKCVLYPVNWTRLSDIQDRNGTGDVRRAVYQ